MSSMSSTSDGRTEVDPPPCAGVARVGCSGWHYKSWRGTIYPDRLPTTSWLRAYARRFCTVELNNSFYRLPAAQTCAGWHEQVPRGFLFSVKASRFLTHIKRLRDPDEPLSRLLVNARPLGASIGALLYQLPPRWFPDAERFEAFLAALPERLTGTRHRLRHVIEMRDSRGYEAWVIDLLRRYDVSLCVHDMAGLESPLVTVGPIVYVRFHGYGVKYGGSYPTNVLEKWATWLRGALATGRDAYVYFNNDINGYAVHDAERFRILVDGEPAVRAHAGRAIATTCRGDHT